MDARLIRKKTRGQSLPLIALMIVVLFGLVALSVDVGNTYAEQREVVRATNSAALAGMTSYVNGGKNVQDSTIYQAIQQSLESNGLSITPAGEQPQPGERTFQAFYLGRDGNPVGCGNVGCGGTAPEGVSYIQVRVSGEVPTYFARVVGTDNLPVNHTSFASQCTPSTGVYPIAVHSSNFDSNGEFAATGDPQYHGTYEDETFGVKRWRQIFVHDQELNPSGNFSWLRWKSETSAGNAVELENMLEGDGNLDEGFEEAPWPTDKNQFPGYEEGKYPEQPGQLNPGDWIHGNSGFSGSNDVRGALDWHMEKRTVMILPIYDMVDGEGVNGKYHIQRLGAFLLLEYGRETGKPYIKLVYIGEANNAACLVTSVDQSTNLGITGSVYFRPRYYEVPDDRDPVQYVIVLDVSGSMNMNFEGQGWRNNQVHQCTAHPDPEIDATRKDCGNPDYAWKTTEERRIYVAKNAIMDLIDEGMIEGDQMYIVSFNHTAYDVSKGKWNGAGPAEKQELKNLVLNKSDTVGGSDPYVTSGGTNGSQALRLATQVLDKADKKDDQGRTYRRAVIFITDGVSNVNLAGQGFNNGTRNKVYPVGDPCRDPNLHPQLAEDVFCQIDHPEPNPDVMKQRPITAMVSMGNLLHQESYNATVYVVAMSFVPDTGLTEVASQPQAPYYSKAVTAAQMQPIFDSIRGDIQYGACVPRVESWQNRIGQNEVGEFAPPNNLSFPIVGYVYLKDGATGSPLPDGKGKAPILVNSETGTLQYNFSDLPPGDYRMEAWVGYKGEDGESRVYSQFFDLDMLDTQPEISFNLGPSDTLGKVVPMDPVYLDMAGVVCSE